MPSRLGPPFGFILGSTTKCSLLLAFPSLQAHQLSLSLHSRPSPPRSLVASRPPLVFSGQCGLFDASTLPSKWPLLSQAFHVCILGKDAALRLRVIWGSPLPQTSGPLSSRLPAPCFLFDFSRVVYLKPPRREPERTKPSRSDVEKSSQGRS